MERSVYALDVDVKQLDWKVRNDPRVKTIELNARFLEPGGMWVNRSISSRLTLRSSPLQCCCREFPRF